MTKTSNISDPGEKLAKMDTKRHLREEGNFRFLETMISEPRPDQQARIAIQVLRGRTF